MNHLSIPRPPGAIVPGSSVPLNVAVADMVAAGWRVTYHDPTRAVLQRGGTRHVLHAILTLFTAGVWLPVWLVLAFVNTGRTVTLTADPHGYVITR